jgi:hypothetical protein
MRTWGGGQELLPKGLSVRLRYAYVLRDGGGDWDLSEP